MREGAENSAKYNMSSQATQFSRSSSNSTACTGGTLFLRSQGGRDQEKDKDNDTDKDKDNDNYYNDTDGDQDKDLRILGNPYDSKPNFTHGIIVIVQRSM